MSFRENLLYLRAAHGMTQEQLAEQLGVSRQSVTKWESDKSYPEMDKLIKLCQIFDCTLDEMVQGDMTDRVVTEAVVESSFEGSMQEEPLRNAAVLAAGQEMHVSAAAQEEPTQGVSDQPSQVAEEGGDPHAASAEHSGGAGQVSATCEEPPAHEDVPAEDVFGYDEHMRRFAERISTGVMAVMLGTAFSIVLYALGDPQSGFALLPENIAAALGTLIVLAGAVTGVALIVPASLDHASFVRQHPHLRDFYTEEDRARARRSFAYELIGGIVLIFIGITLIILFSETPLEAMVGTPLMLAFVAFGVKPIIHGSMVLGMTNIADYNEAAAEVLEAHEIKHMDIPAPQKQELLQKSVQEKRIGALCGSIMIVASIVGLVMLFVPHYQNDLFWLAWPIGGLLCGLVSLLMKGFSHE